MSPVARPSGKTQFALETDAALYEIMFRLANGTNASPKRRDRVMYGKENESRLARTQFTAHAVMQKPAK